VGLKEREADPRRIAVPTRVPEVEKVTPEDPTIVGLPVFPVAVVVKVIVVEPERAPEPVSTPEVENVRVVLPTAVTGPVALLSGRFGICGSTVPSRVPSCQNPIYGFRTRVPLVNHRVIGWVIA
jgi:hypothetical protein